MTTLGVDLAQLTDDEILHRIIHGDIEAADGVAALINRQTGCLAPSEGPLIDYKLLVNFGDTASIAELARDILGFSNAEGGVVVLGVADGLKNIESHVAVDFRVARENLGYFLGTRVNFDMDECTPTVLGSARRLITITVRESASVYPNLLRKDVQLRAGFIRKVKYVR